MRFFTDHYFTDEQKAELLGSSYNAYMTEQQRKKQLEQERQSCIREIELEKLQQKLEQQSFDKNSMNAELAILAFIIIATLISGLGIPLLFGDI